jgi:NADPH:quinone reductase-like Zn-dependent oxidoreductase
MVQGTGLPAIAGAADLERASLDDKYAVGHGRVFMTGTQTLVRLPMLKAISAGSRAMVENLLAALAQNRIRPVIAQVVPFENAAEAWRAIRRGEQVGKIVIKVA